jgi:hypothetical protein
MLTDKDIRALLVKYASQSLSFEDEKLLDSLMRTNRKKLSAVLDAELAAYDHPGIIPEDLKQLEKLKSELRFWDKRDDPNHWTNRYPRIYRAFLRIILILPLLCLAFMIYIWVRWLFSDIAAKTLLLAPISSAPPFQPVAQRLVAPCATGCHCLRNGSLPSAQAIRAMRRRRRFGNPTNYSSRFAKIFTLEIVHLLKSYV